jgi:hypothetical protein
MKLTSKEVCNFMKWLGTNVEIEEGGAFLSYFINSNMYVTKDQDSVACVGPLAAKWKKDLPGINI